MSEKVKKKNISDGPKKLPRKIFDALSNFAKLFSFTCELREHAISRVVNAVGIERFRDTIKNVPTELLFSSGFFRLCLSKLAEI
jgi:hypothetical protein